MQTIFKGSVTPQNAIRKFIASMPQYYLHASYENSKYAFVLWDFWQDKMVGFMKRFIELHTNTAKQEKTGGEKNPSIHCI